MAQTIKLLPQVVESCDECPFRLYHPEERNLCSYGEQTGRQILDPSNIPEWCPLDDV